MKTQLLFIATLALLFAGCKKDDNSPSGGGSGGGQPNPSSGSFTMKVDGANWVASGLTGTFTGQSLILQADKGNELFQLTLTGDVPGNYPVTTPPGPVVLSFDNSVDEVYNNQLGGQGIVNITRMDNEMVEGEFLIEGLKNISGDTITITDGKFSFVRPATLSINLSSQQVVTSKGSQEFVQVIVDQSAGAQVQSTLRATVLNGSSINAVIDPSSGTGDYSADLSLDFSSPSLSSGTHYVAIDLLVQGVVKATDTIECNIIAHHADFLAGDYNVTQPSGWPFFPGAYPATITLDATDLTKLYFNNFMNTGSAVEMYYDEFSGDLLMTNQDQQISSDWSVYELVSSSINGSGETGTVVVVTHYVRHNGSLYETHNRWEKK